MGTPPPPSASIFGGAWLWGCGTSGTGGVIAALMGGDEADLAVRRSGVDDKGCVDGRGAVSGSIRRTTKLATMRSAGRLTEADERTPMIPHVILRT